jgi:hypothetical protein
MYWILKRVNLKPMIHKLVQKSKNRSQHNKNKNKE